MEDESKKELNKYKKAITLMKTNLEKEQKLKQDALDSLAASKKICDELENKLRDLDIEQRKKSEEVETLQFNNNRLSKRVESLQQEINNVKNQKSTGFLNNIWTGKQKDSIEKLEKQLEIIQEDLQIKIYENEQIHMNLYDIKKANQEKIEDLEGKMKKYHELNDMQTKLISDYKYNEEKLRGDLEEIERQKRNLETELSEKLSEITSIKNDFIREKNEMEKKLQATAEIVSKRLPFNESENKFYNSLNSKAINKENLNRQQEWISRSIPANTQILNVYEECCKTILGKLRLLQTELESHHKSEYQLFLFYSRKVISSIENFSNSFDKFFQGLVSIARLYLQINIKKVVKEPNEVKKINEQIEEQIYDQLQVLGELVSLFGHVQANCTRMLIEEYNLVDNIALLKSLNEPISNNSFELKSLLETLLSYVKALFMDIGPGSDKFFFPENNYNCILTQILNSINNISKKMDHLFENLKKKFTAENNSLVEGDKEVKNNESILFSFQIKVSLALKNHNNDMMNNIQSLKFGLNSFFSIIFQMFQQQKQSQKSQKNALPLATNPNVKILDGNTLRDIQMLNKLNNFGEKALPGVPYTKALENKTTISELQKKEKTLSEQIKSLKQALRSAELQLENLRDVSDTSTVDSASTELSDTSVKELKDQLELYKNSLEKARAKYSKLCSETNREVTNEDLQEFTIAGRDLKQEPIKKNEYVFDVDSDFSINENIQKGLQRLSLKLLNDKNKIKPLNELISNDSNSSEKIGIVYEYAKGRIIKLLVQNEILAQRYAETEGKQEGISKQLENERRAKEIADANFKNLERHYNKTKAEIESLKQGYENQIKMLSECLAAAPSPKKK